MIVTNDFVRLICQTNDHCGFWLYFSCISHIYVFFFQYAILIHIDYASKIKKIPEKKKKFPEVVIFASHTHPVFQLAVVHAGK